MEPSTVQANQAVESSPIATLELQSTDAAEPQADPSVPEPVVAPPTQGKPAAPRTHRGCLIAVLIGLLALVAALALLARILPGTGGPLARFAEVQQKEAALAAQLGEAFPGTQEVEVTHNSAWGETRRDSLEIKVLNTAYADLPADEQQAKAKEIACLAKQVYADIDRIGTIYIAFTEHVDSSLAVNIGQGYWFAVEMLECPSAAPPQASASRAGG